VRRLGVVALLAAAVLACAAATSAAENARQSRGGLTFLITASHIGTLRISLTTTDRHLFAFLTRSGQHGSSVVRADHCTLGFGQIGLHAWLNGAFSGRTTASNCTLFPGRVEVRYSRWHTAKGLHVGATVEELHRLYPKAAGGGGTGRGFRPGGIPAHAREWQLTNLWWRHRDYAAHLELVAYVRMERVVTLGVEAFGH
jgi:hypothetical protein